MRHLELDAVVPGAAAGHVFDTITKFERYPDLAPHVRATTVRAAWPQPVGESSWELYFRSGILRWSEHEHFRKDELTICFEQDEGDFDSFSGRWTLRQDGDGVAVHFECDFDFGIPSMEGILDPIAERVIKESVAWVVVGLFPGAVLAEHVDLPAPAAGG